MALHIFVDKDQELIINIIRGDDKEAARFLKHPNEHKLTHIHVKNGHVAIGD